MNESTDPTTTPPVGVLHVPDNFEDAERFQRLFVAPMIEMVKKEMTTHVSTVTGIVQAATLKVDAMRADVDKLKADQKHALVGYGIFSTGLAVGMAAAWKWATSKIKFN